MANEINIQLDSFLETGLTLVAKVFNKTGTQQGSDVSLSETSTGFYSGDFTVSSLADGDYVVKFQTTTEHYGSGMLSIKGGVEAIPSTKAELDAAQSAIQTDIAGIETALTSSDIEAIATAVEAAILNETDGQAILEAIVNAIGNENIDQIALVAAIRSDLERAGGSLDNLPTLAEIESSALAKEATIAALNNISISDINLALASYDAATETDVNKAVVDVLLAQRDMKDNLDILNTGVKKSSLLIPHVNDLEEVEYTPLSPQDSDAFVTARGLIFNASEE